MNKKITCFIFVLLLLPGIIVADEYSEQTVFDRTFCLSLGGSHTITAEVRNTAGQSLDFLDKPGWIYTYGFKYYMFDRKVGFGMDYTKSSETSGLFSMNAYLRIPVSEKVALIGGTGFTMTFNDSLKAFDVGMGENVQLGTEIALTSRLSVSAILSWYEIEMIDFYTYKTVVEFTSFILSVNLYL